MFTVEPIGHVCSPFRDLADAPRQPYVARGVAGQIELVRGKNLEDAIEDLASWEYLWVLFWFHRAGGYRPKVLPPRSSKRRGVLATRSPHRPNPIGMSVVRLTAIEGLTLHIEDMDMLDGTPVLDIKPFVAWADNAPTSGPGWLDSPPDPVAAFVVAWDPLAAEQLAWLAARQVALREAIEQRLALGPQPRAYRRIRIVGGKHQLAYKAWRCWFRAEGNTLTVERLDSGYRQRELHQIRQRQKGDEAELAIHREFADCFGARRS